MRNVKMPRNRHERRRCPFTPPYPEDAEETERAECSVCGVPLDERKRPKEHQFCDRHSMDDLQVREDVHRREQREE